MADVIHEQDSGNNSAMLAVIIILVIAIGAFLLWRFLPAKQNTGGNSQPTVNINLGASSTPGGGSTY